jgi:protein O-GlcNAc transferase
MTKRSPETNAPQRGPVTAAGSSKLQPALAQAMQQALGLYSRREWSQAEQVCRMILSAQATHFDALNLLGIMAAQTQRLQEAAELLGRAAALRRDEPTVHNNYGNVLRDLARHPEALRSYNRAIQINPKYAEAHYNRGLTLQDLKRPTDALSSYDLAIKFNPDYAAAHNNRGVVLRELKRLDEAIASHDRAIALRPDYATAYNNRGVALQEMKRTEAALESYTKALAIKSGYAEALHNQGSALRDLHRFDEALASFERAVSLDSNYAGAYTGRGVTLQHLDRHQEALADFDRAIAIDPNDAQAHYSRGNALRAIGLADQAMSGYRRAFEINPDLPADPYHRASVLHEMQRFDDALPSYLRALEVDPDQPWLRGICLQAKMRICDWTDYDAGLAELAAAIRQSKTASPPFVAVTMLDSPELQLRAAQIWVEQTCPPESLLPPLSRRAPAEKIRIGYFSADFYNHATALLAGGLFEQHDRDKFEIIAFNFGPVAQDEVTGRLMKAFDRFIDVHTRKDVEIAQLARELQLDIAVDLKGFTLHQRAAIFAHRAAPIQVAYLGYPGTMGAPFIDYIVADEIVIPAETREQFTEKVVHLPGSYQVNGRSRPTEPRGVTRADLGLPSNGLVFCSFNNVYKITPSVFECWMRILKRVDSSVLWLLQENDTASRNLREAAERAGVDPRRLIFTGRVPLAQHLGRHRLADLSLDTFPCNAHTTASDSLWAGLPLLTCAGESFCARVAASLLNAAGVPELVTTSLAEYEEMAVGLAQDRERLAGFAERLQMNRMTLPLFDAARFARHLEEAYLQMYRRYQAGSAPQHIRIDG